jgi:hypothetical protein
MQWFARSPHPSAPPSPWESLILLGLALNLLPPFETRRILRHFSPSSSSKFLSESSSEEDQPKKEKRKLIPRRLAGGRDCSYSTTEDVG